MNGRYIFWITTIGVLSIITTVLIFYFKVRTVKEYYEDGKLKTIYYSKQGKLEGQYNEFYQNGKIKLKAHFTNGIQDDTLKAYYNNGASKEVSLFKNGKKEGFYEDFYLNGKRKSIGWAKNGFKDSVFIYYSSKERIDSVIHYRTGKVRVRAHFDMGGQINYQDFENNFSLSFPQSWEFDLSRKDAILLLRNVEGKSLGEPTESLNIMRHQLQSAMNIKEFVMHYLESLEHNLSSFKALDINYSDNHCEIVYAAKYSERKLKAYVKIVCEKDVAYIITCVSDEQNFKAFENIFEIMTNSFGKAIPHQSKRLFLV